MFGSQVTGNAHQGSDIDILVTFLEEKEILTTTWI
ncbi:MAG: nucleotidyltransferase domain-containing protein [Methanospirillum sp.]|nr:nucleotidyltransferase domain-containing protein [Methanospirillum sp.]MDD1729505.1 nucleotidyltransferase domain-containing protein [Methanospirillum sp.]